MRTWVSTSRIGTSQDEKTGGGFAGLLESLCRGIAPSDSVGPLLPVTLPAAVFDFATEQRLLATWAVKTALMFDAVTGKDAVIPSAFIQSFCLSP